MRAAFVALTVAAVGGCRLIDQTSFGAAPRAPAPQEVAVAFASNGELPLLVVRPGDGVSYDDALRRAIELAETHGAAVSFRLEALVPARGDVDAQAATLAAYEPAVRAVLDVMGVDGITPDRVSLSARADPHLQKAEIRLFQN